MDTQSQQTSEESRIDPNDTSWIEKGKSSWMTLREALGLHELAAIMQFDTSCELVEWLTQ